MGDINMMRREDEQMQKNEIPQIGSLLGIFVALPRVRFKGGVVSIDSSFSIGLNPCEKYHQIKYLRTPRESYDDDFRYDVYLFSLSQSSRF